MEINTYNIKLVVDNDDVSKFKHLIESGLDINSIITSDNKNVLIYCVVHGATKITKYLIEIGADLNVQDDFGYTCTMISAYRNDLDTLLLFVKNGADLSIKDNNGKTIFDVDRWVISREEFHEYICEYQPGCISYIKDDVSDDLKNKYKLLFRMEGIGLL